jgi:hypothetical protein
LRKKQRSGRPRRRAGRFEFGNFRICEDPASGQEPDPFWRFGRKAGATGATSMMS